MQSLENTLVNNSSSLAFQGIVLSNVTNQNTPTLSPHSSQKSSQIPSMKQDYCSKESSSASAYLPVNNTLQQENQILKTQIEVLKQALVELCKDQKHNSQIGPLLNQVQNENLEQELYHFINQLSHQQFLQQTHIRSSSPKKSQPKQSRDNSILPVAPYGDSKQSPSGKAPAHFSSHKKSALISSNRRRRCDRVTTPCNQNESITHQYQVNNYVESKFNVTPTATNNSRSIIKEIPLQICNSKLKLRLDNEEHTSRVIEYEVQESRIIQSPLQQNMDDIISIVDEGSQSQQDQKSLNKDSSQIQLKYAKMLEELEISSQNYIKVDSKINETTDKIEREATISGNENNLTPLKDDYSLQSFKQIEGPSFNQKKRSFSSGCSKMYHMKNKKSSQFEHKQFYEQELSALKSELEQFTKEEEKLLSILECSQQAYSVRQSRSSSPFNDQTNQVESNLQLDQGSIKNEVQVIEEVEVEEDDKTPIKQYSHQRECSFSQQSIVEKPEMESLCLNLKTPMIQVLDQEEATQMEKSTELKKSTERLQTLSQQEMLENLAEATKYLIEGEGNGDNFMKPVKIESPNCEREEEEQPLIEEEQIQLKTQSKKPPSVSEDSEQTLYHQNRNKTPKIQRKVVPQQITPVRQQIQQQQSTSADRHLKKGSMNQQKDSLGRDSEKGVPQPQQNQILHSKKSSLNSIQTTNRNQKGFISQQKQRPSNVHAYVQASSNTKKSKQVKQELKNGKNSSQFSIYQIFKTISNNQSPLKSILKSERRYKEESNNEENEEGDIYEEENMTREQKLQSLEQLSKRQSLVRGLRQQEVPTSDDEEGGKTKALKGKEDIKQAFEQRESFGKQETPSKLGQDLFASGNYFGLYSKEKSEELKNQRYESIKKAEELLSQFIIEKSARPTFINSILTRPLQVQESQVNQVTDRVEQYPKEAKEQTPTQALGSPRKYISDQIGFLDDEYKTFVVEDKDCRIIEEEDSRKSHNMFDETVFNQQSMNFGSKENGMSNANEISFQNQELCQVSFVRNSFKGSGKNSRSSSRQQQTTFLNIEIPAVLRSPMKKEEESSYQDIHQLEEQRRSYQAGLRIVRRSSLNELQQPTGTLDHQYSDLNKDLAQEQPTPEKKGGFQDYQKRTFINNRRKSHELCKARGGAFSQQKKSTMIKKKRIEQISPLGQHVYPQMNQTSSHTAFQKFNLGANCYDKYGKSQNRIAETITIGGQEESSWINQMNNRLSQKIFNQTFIDPEFFYEKRSKSVIKRREDLMRKKEEQNRSKIEAKYQKIDQIRQTRNQKLGTANAHSQNRVSNKHPRQPSRGKCQGQSASYFNQGKQGDDDSYLEINANKSPLDQNYLSTKDRKSTLIVDANKHVHNYFQEKEKTSDMKANQNITPLSVPPVHQTIPNPSFQTTNCKTSLLMSECSSFRQGTTSHVDQQKLLLSQQTTSKSQSKVPACNLAYKKHNLVLKNNIINRTLRIDEGSVLNAQSKGKPTQPEVSQNTSLKKMQSTIEISAYSDYKQQVSDKNSTMNSTLHGSQSFINNKIHSQMSNKSNNAQAREQQSKNGSTIINKKYVMKKKEQKHMNSSRSIKKITVDLNSQQNQSHYNSKKTTVSNASSNQVILGGVDLQNAVFSANNCQNCFRLINKGLSTDFCLQHVGTSRLYD